MAEKKSFHTLLLTAPILRGDIVAVAMEPALVDFPKQVASGTPWSSPLAAARSTSPLEPRETETSSGSSMARPN